MNFIRRYLNPVRAARSLVSLLKTRWQNRTAGTVYSEQPSLFEMQFASVKEDMEKRSKGREFYDLPWLLCLGGDDGEQRKLLRQSLQDVSAHPAPEPPGEGGVAWWLMDGFVAIETAANWADQGNGIDALNVLKKVHHGSAVNGFVVFLSAPTLLEDAAAIRDRASVIRQQLDEMAKVIGRKVPVFLVISQIAQLGGWRQFHSQFGGTVLDRALGARIKGQFQGDVLVAVLEEELGAISERLASLRLEMLLRESGAVEKLALFEFVEGLRRVLDNLPALADVLFREAAIQDAPFCRSVYLMELDEPAGFTTDVSRRLLVNDTHLVR